MPRLAGLTLTWLCLLSASALQGGEVDYVRDIRPLLKLRCFACHGALKSQAGLRLDTTNLMLKGGQSGPAIEPGKSTESLLLDAVTGSNGITKMPPAGQAEMLTDEQIGKLKAWIDAGAQHPADERPEADPKQHWAFQPPIKSTLPAVQNPAAVQNPIDAFVVSQLQKQGLTQSGPADRATLLRRVTIDLTGLPPARADLHSFLADTSPQAYEHVVDRLLASPQYGERWARHWMDVWRYADWHGRRNVPDWWNSASQIWRWRDWIVASLNQDKGYNRMVMEMIAADEIAPEDDAALVATGYLARNWYALNYNQWMRDNVEHTAKAFLGLTFQCAHCHDHKYDPISQEDYFRFRAFFEPLELRQDRLPGEPDPGAFQKYSYGVLRKVVRNGSIRVFDERLSAPTLMYSGGDERNKIEGKPPILPGLPSILSPELKIESMTLPVTVSYPGLRPFVRQEELAPRRAALQAAEGTWKQSQAQSPVELPARELELSLVGYELAAVQQADPSAVPLVQERLREAQLLVDEITIPRSLIETQFRNAQAQLAALEARIAADNAKYLGQGGPPDELAKAASVTERRAAVMAAELAAAQADQKRLDLRKQPATDAAALKGAEQQLTAAREAVKKAQLVLATESSTYTPLGPQYPSVSSGRRKALAEWMAHRNNPLTARVAVNHIWLRHFGQPLVESVYDFGRNGKAPSHPELLDWLAVEFMESGWSQRHLHRLIVTSATYQQASQVNGTSEPNAQRDPDNRWLWRFPRRRVESEVVHDAFLSVAEELDLKVGGQEVENDQAETSRRRTLYFSVHPEDGGRMKFLENFDAPDPVDCYRRTESVIPQQALALTNSPISRSLSRKLAGKLWQLISESPQRRDELVTMAFEQVLTRAPTPAEQQQCVAFLTRQTQVFQQSAGAGNQAQSTASPELKAYESLVHSLFSHNDFVTIK